jgi:hypothetical protein
LNHNSEDREKEESDAAGGVSSSALIKHEKLQSL